MMPDALTRSDVLAGVAFVLALASFWNEYFARGRVVLARPLGVTLMQAQLTSGHGIPQGWSHLWRMNLVFCNTGARHVLVHNVRLVVQDGDRRVALQIGQWLRTVKPQDDESSLTAAGGDFAGSFAIAPRGIFERASLFRARPTADPWLNQEGRYQCAVEALLDRRWRKPSWATLTTFSVALTGEPYAWLAEPHWIHLQAED